MDHINKYQDSYDRMPIMERASGILLHITSLPGPYGIGTFGNEAYDFVDFLATAKQRYWQVLPIGPTGGGNSPYQSFSSFAGNPYLIDLELLSQEGLLSEEFRHVDFSEGEEKVDYEKTIKYKNKYLLEAFLRGKDNLPHEFYDFIKNEKNWLNDYALFMAIRKEMKELSWDKWEPGLRNREENAIKEAEKRLETEILFEKFTQYHFFKQYWNLKNYAHENGVQLIGDLPIYVAYDSVEVWKEPHLFQLDENRNPLYESGVPPDGFSESGQKWGNPLYRWDKMKDDQYQWWIDRLAASLSLFDVLRLDHFRGFEAYWRVPMGQEAKEGDWVQGPGMDFFERILEKFPEAKIIAEDLGFITEEVDKMRMQAGFPGMKILQFAFSPAQESVHLPHNVERNSVMYTGTHDNDTVKGWVESSPKENLDYARSYLKISEEEGDVWGMIRGVWSSTSSVAIAQMQDFLELGSEGRMNVPGTVDHWTWRVRGEVLTKNLAYRIKILSRLYSRYKED